ncbi:pre-mRNA-splicing factor rse1 [Coemansia sp. BCRC 34301]|nr:pre-mRNA-splicing factor rse1 [Coemansia sp. BCRC 34301]
MAGGNKDYIVLASDTGAIAIIEFRSGRFVTVQYHEFGRTGLRRLVAGQYVAADPRGRAVMVAAVERSKIVYIVTRDSEARLMLASPLEANRTGSVCFDVVGVDVGYENPVFAAIESNYEDASSGKQLVYYELDLGLNHVVRKWSVQVGESAHRLIGLPGGDDGPSGVLVCLEGGIEYRHFTAAGGEAMVHAVTIPRHSQDREERGAMIVAHAVHRMKKAFFILAQTESGDLFKITVDFASDSVSRVGIKYFDTVLAGASSISILRAGFLFAAAGGPSGGSHQLFQFENLGEDKEEKEEDGFFERHAELQSLVLVDEIEGAWPVIKSQVLHVAHGEEAPQIYAACGTGPRSSLKIMRHGAEVAEVVALELPGAAQGVWALGGDLDLIVVSFGDSTLVLQAGSEGDELVSAGDSLGLGLDEATLGVAAVDGGGLVQVTRRAVRHIRADGRVTEWAAPAPASITCAAVNARQAVVGLSRGAQCVYFELDERLELREHSERLAVGGDVTCVALAPVAPTRLLAGLVAVGCSDQTVRVHALDAPRCLEPLSLQAVAAAPSAVGLADHGSADLLLYAGLANGLLVRARVDAASGDVSDTRTRFLGAQAVRLCAAADAVVALAGGAPWLCHMTAGRVQATPLSYDAVDWCAAMSGGGLVCVAGADLRVLTVDRAGSALTSATIPLAHTPRAFCVHDASRFFALIETDADSSLVRVVSPFDGTTVFVDDLASGLVAVSLAPVRFAADPDHEHVAVGCKQGPSGCVRLYRWTGDGRCLELVHVTPVDGVPQALLPFAGLLAVALGAGLALFDAGLKRLLRKAYTPSVAPHRIAALHAHPTLPATRLLAADVRESLLAVAFNASTRVFHVTVSDTLPRHVTALCALDDGFSVVGADKFGSLFVLRAPAEATEKKPGRWQSVAEFHVGDIVTAINACSLAPHACPVILYSTLLGAVHVAVPMVSQNDVDFFVALEAAMRQLPSVAGRDHLAYRSSFMPVRSVVDGDLCEAFYLLSHAQREIVAAKVDRTQHDIMKKMEDIRAMFAF